MNIILIGFIIFLAVYGFFWLTANMNKKKFSNLFRTSTILFSIVCIILLFVAGRYLLSLPFFAVLASILKRSLFNIFNLIYIYRFISAVFNIKKNKKNSSFGSSLSEVKEAYNILGLNRNCTKEDIVKAHKRLIKEAHPDKLGDNEKASKINRARDILLEIHK